jgi:cytochrome c oxidase subunit II
MIRRRSARAVALASLAALAGCNEATAALDPAGIQAERIDGLFWLFTWVSAAVWVLVVGAIAGAVGMRYLGRIRGERARREREDDETDDQPLLAPDERSERRLARGVGGALVATVATLFVLLASDFALGRSLSSLAEEADLTVRITGHQWWWEVEYLDDRPTRNVTTANELRLPVGRTARIELVSHDVIHSFWVPELHGKTDLIPGHPTSTYVRAERAGTWTGRCAEYCGLQHANMRLDVVAEPDPSFRTWLASQLEPARSPDTATRERGQRVFLDSTCVMCHTIAGTTAGGRIGPSLTHVASRRSLAAGTLPNAPGHLAGWIVDPQRSKPGVHMPMNSLAPEDLLALVDYLGSLE